MRRKPLILIISSFFSVAAATVCVVLGTKHQAFVSAENATDAHSMTLSRSVTAEEIVAGQATFNTANDNPIVFGFDSSKASTSSGLITLASGGSFYNDTKVTGITQMEITLASGSAKLCYGNDKEAVCAGSATLSGTTPIVVNFEEPSDYFKISDVTGPLTISNMKLSYDCSNTYDPSMAPVLYESGTKYADFTMDGWASSQRSVSFVVKTANENASGSFTIRLCDQTKTAVGYAVNITISSGSFSPASPMNVEYLGDGWYKLILDGALLSKQAGKDGTETVKYLQIANVNTPIKVGRIQAENMFKPQNTKYYNLPETIVSYNTSSKYLTFKVKKVSASAAGVVQMNLSNGNTNSYGIRFTFVANGAPTVTGGSNRACSSVEDLGGGWYLITTQTGQQIMGSAFDASKIYYSNYSGANDFYLKDLSVH